MGVKKWANGAPGHGRQPVKKSEAERYLGMLIDLQGLDWTIERLAKVAAAKAILVRAHYPDHLDIAKHFEAMATRINSLRDLEPAKRLT